MVSDALSAKNIDGSDVHADALWDYGFVLNPQCPVVPSSCSQAVTCSEGGIS